MVKQKTAPAKFQDTGRLKTSSKRPTPTATLTLNVYIVKAGREIMMATHLQEDAQTYIKTYNRLRKQDTPAACVVTRAVEV